MRKLCIPILLLSTLILTAGPWSAMAQGGKPSLQSAVLSEIGRIVTSARGTVGVAALHLETGRKVDFLADEFFPMASTVKVAVAAKILDMADKGQINLAAQFPVEQMEMAPEGPVGDMKWHKGLSFSGAELLGLMIIRSDNTATDVLYRVAGGPAAVQAYLQGLGLKDIHTDRYIRDLLRDVLSIPPAKKKMSLADQFKKMPPKQAAERRERAYRANPAYDADPRDQATPATMLVLLTKIWRGESVSPSARSALVSLMERCKTGTKRIRGRLPAGTVVADKTGTLAGTLNDVGYVTLPDGKGHIALVVFIKGSEVPPSSGETVIADVARLLYDYFLLVE